MNQGIRYYCQNKGCYKEVSVGDEKCSNCGSKLDWKALEKHPAPMDYVTWGVYPIGQYLRKM